MFLSQSCSSLAHVAALRYPHTHPHIYLCTYRSTLTACPNSWAVSLLQTHTNTHSRHYSTELSFVQSEGDGLIVQQHLWPSSDTRSKSAIPCFCRHKQERLPAGCIIQTWLARWMNNQLAEVKWGEGADANNEIISCVFLLFDPRLFLFSLIKLICSFSVGFLSLGTHSFSFLSSH